MIKIIEYGTITETRCNNCGCRFAYEREDIQYDSIQKVTTAIEQFDEMKNPRVICPQCKAIVKVKQPKTMK